MHGDRLRLLRLGHTPSIFTAVANASIFSSIDALFVAMDEGKPSVRLCTSTIDK
jgi:hypothetical protein